MQAKKKARLERAGWAFGDAKDLLGLDDAEAVYVEIRAALASTLVNRRRQLKLSQTLAAKRLRSSQSRVAKMEAGDASVSVDLLVRSLLYLGNTRKDVARAIAGGPRGR